MEHFLWFQIHHFSPFDVTTVVESNKISFSPSLTTTGKLAVGLLLHYSPEWLFRLDFTLKCFSKRSALVYMHMCYPFHSQWQLLFFFLMFLFLKCRYTSCFMWKWSLRSKIQGSKNSRLFSKYNCTMCFWQYSVYDQSSRYDHVSS